MHHECIMQVAADLEPDRKRLIVGPRDAALRKARTYYDHFAGQLGVALADALVEQGRIGLTNDAGMLGVGFRSASAMSGSFEGEKVPEPVVGCSWSDCAATDTGQHQFTKLLVRPIALSHSLELVADALNIALMRRMPFYQSSGCTLPRRN